MGVDAVSTLGFHLLWKLQERKGEHESLQRALQCPQIHFVYEHALFQTVWLNRYLTVHGHCLKFHLLSIYSLDSREKRNHLYTYPYPCLYLQLLYVVFLFFLANHTPQLKRKSVLITHWTSSITQKHVTKTWQWNEKWLSSTEKGCGFLNQCHRIICIETPGKGQHRNHQSPDLTHQAGTQSDRGSN